jgi:hypothetical protein
MLACLLVGELDRLGRGARYTLSPWLIVAQRLAEVKPGDPRKVVSRKRRCWLFRPLRRTGASARDQNPDLAIAGPP